MDKLNKDDIKSEMMEVLTNYQDMLLILKEIAADKIIDPLYDKNTNASIMNFLHEGVITQINIIIHKHMKFPSES